ncbi:hypothetical protein ACOSP7_014098 [Xanthoceras sorbifolium]
MLPNQSKTLNSIVHEPQIDVDNHQCIENEIKINTKQMGTSGFDEGSEDERAKVVPFLKDDEMKKVECLRAEVVGDEEVGHGGV